MKIKENAATYWGVSGARLKETIKNSYPEHSPSLQARHPIIAPVIALICEVVA